MLRVKLLDPGARLPVVAHPGEDLGYDVFGLESLTLAARQTTRLRTGIAVEARHPAFDVTPCRYVSAIITERGVAREPYTESLKALFG